MKPGPAKLEKGDLEEIVKSVGMGISQVVPENVRYCVILLDGHTGECSIASNEAAQVIAPLLRAASEMAFESIDPARGGNETNH